jgi:hypothetical protein
MNFLRKKYSFDKKDSSEVLEVNQISELPNIFIIFAQKLTEVFFSLPEFFFIHIKINQN